MTTPIDIDRLEALAESAMSTPWYWRHFGDDPECGIRIVHYPADVEKPWEVVADEIYQPDNAEFIVRLRNAAPSLLAAYRAVQRVEAMLAEAEQIGDPRFGRVPTSRLRAALDGAE